MTKCTLLSIGILVFINTSYSHAVTEALDVDMTQIAEISNSLDVMSNLGDFKDSAMATVGLTSQGVGGEANTPNPDLEGDGTLSSITGGISDALSQRAPWTFEEEMLYSFENDYSDPSLLMDCMEYSIVGWCLSVRWTMFGPKFTNSFAVEHFVRDVHAEVVPQAPAEDIFEAPDETVLPSSNSTVEDIIMMYPFMWRLNRELGSSLLMDGINSVLEDAEGQTVPTKNSKYLYNDVLISGNIERSLFDAVGGSLIGIVGYCNSPTLAGVSYFSSSLDQFSWRWLATSEVILQGLYQIKYMEWNDIGRGYGSTMPRSGYIDSVDRFRSSVISAIRGTSIAAENRALFSGLAGLHIYMPLPQYAESSFTGSKYQTPQDAKSFKLDMIYPYQGERCTRYNANESWYEGALSPAAQYEEDRLTSTFSKNNGNNTAIYKIYRPFRCCKKRGSAVFDIVIPGSIGQPK